MNARPRSQAASWPTTRCCSRPCRTGSLGSTLRPSPLRYARWAKALGIKTSLKSLRHYSATELISQASTSAHVPASSGDEPVLKRTPRPWPLVLIGLAAAVSVWSGWVGLGQLAGFGIVKPLPGLVDSLEVNSAIVLSHLSRGLRRIRPEVLAHHPRDHPHSQEIRQGLGNRQSGDRRTRPGRLPLDGLSGRDRRPMAGDRRCGVRPRPGARTGGRSPIW